MLVCLVLAAATKDGACIKATVQLDQANLLSPEALMKAPISQIQKCIKVCGIDRVRAIELKEMSKCIVTEHGGQVPGSREKLEQFAGVGRKTSTLCSNEIFGFFEGIPTDTHVMNVAAAIGLYKPPDGSKNLYEPHVEISLRKWMPAYDFKDANKVFGSFAQMFTQDLRVMDDSNAENVETLIESIAFHFSSMYHIEMLWFMIYHVRKHYREVKV